MDSACSDKSAIASRVLRLHTPSMRPCTRLQNANFSSTILESFAGSLTFLAFPKVSTILESYIALESKDLSLRALAQDKARQSISAQADSKKAQNRETLESYIDSQNHKTRCRRSFFSKSTSSDSTLESTFSHNAPFLSLRADLSAWQSIQKTAQLLESTFEKSHDSKSHAHSLSSRDLRQQVVAIHKSAQADSSNAADFTTAKKVDSSKDYSASAECMDCHAIATALARNDKKNAASKKVDSKSEAQNLKTPAKDSRICDEKPLLCKPRKEIRLAVYRRSAAQQSKVYRAKPNPQTQKPTPKPQRLPL